MLKAELVNWRIHKTLVLINQKSFHAKLVEVYPINTIGAKNEY